MAKPDIYLEKGFVMLARPNRNPYFETGRFEERMLQMENPFLIYSMWEGYLRGGKAEDPAIVKFIDERIAKNNMEILHTNGHAYVETLKKLMDMTEPEMIIPMHTENAAAFEQMPEFLAYKNRIHRLSDGETFEL
ncbi:MAG: hypothetical protein IJ679_00635 [Lachnospiraceae bacterium]|nr:hypothetical protein [Lachnospiraceae bacterium]